MANQSHSFIASPFPITVQIRMKEEGPEAGTHSSVRQEDKEEGTERAPRDLEVRKHRGLP